MAIPSITVTPDQAIQAYRNAQQPGGADEAGGVDFGTALGNALKGAIATGHAADQQSMAALQGKGDVTSLVMAVSKADLALSTTAAIRDRIVQAYQDIMRMAI